MNGQIDGRMNEQVNELPGVGNFKIASLSFSKCLKEKPSNHANIKHKQEWMNKWTNKLIKTNGIYGRDNNRTEQVFTAKVIMKTSCDKYFANTAKSK